MDSAQEKYSKNAVNRAARLLAERFGLHTGGLREWEDCVRKVQYWRSAHSFPLKATMTKLDEMLRQMGLRDSTVVGRLKRLPAIVRKLRRFENMQLTTMQDIGGCRVVVGRLQDVNILCSSIKSAKESFNIVKEYDYLASPPDSGYRSVHLINQLDLPNFDGCASTNIEIQVRTRIQHSWATAVETVDAFLGQDLKLGNTEGKWYEFFRQIAVAFGILESRPLPVFPDDMRESIRQVERELAAVSTLEAFSGIMQYFEESKSGGYYHLIELTTGSAPEVVIESFSASEISEAERAYARREIEGEGISGRYTVLVRASSLDELRTSYPNYFGDTAGFMVWLRALLGGR